MIQPQRQMRFQWPPLTPWVRALLIVIGGVFLLEVLVRILLGFDSSRFHAFIVEPLGLSGQGIWHYQRFWQPLTYFWVSPLHSLWPIVFSLITIYFFGPPIESQLGGPRMLIAFITAGIAGGLVAGGFAGLYPESSAVYNMMFIGPEAATTGLVATLCWWWKDDLLNLIVVSLKGWHLLAIFTALILLQGLLNHPYMIVPQCVGLLIGIAVGSGMGPYALYQRVRLWLLRRKIREMRGGKDDRDWMN